MSGILYTEAAAVEATSGHMLVTFTSGGEDFRFHIPAHIALKLRHLIMTDGWQVCCAPDAEVVSLAARRAKAKREGRAKLETAR
jgi:hypothetical protein